MRRNLVPSCGSARQHQRLEQQVREADRHDCAQVLFFALVLDPDPAQLSDGTQCQLRN